MRELSLEYTYVYKEGGYLNIYIPYIDWLGSCVLLLQIQRKSEVGNGKLNYIT